MTLGQQPTGKKLEKNLFTEANYEHELIMRHQYGFAGSQMHGKCEAEAYCKIQSLSIGVLGKVLRKFSKLSSLKLYLALILAVMAISTKYCE